MLNLWMLFPALMSLLASQVLQQSVHDEPVIVYADPVALPVPVTMAKPSQAPTGHAKPRKPKVRLSCLPKIGHCSPSKPMVVRATLRITDPNEELWCPGVEWYVNNTFVSGHESDCKPYDEVVAEEGERGLWSEPPKPFGFYTGDYTIQVKLTRASRVIRTVSCEVSVR